MYCWSTWNEIFIIYANHMRNMPFSKILKNIISTKQPDYFFLDTLSPVNKKFF